MRVLGGDFVRHYSGRMVNIHPSLLPAFPGLHTHRRALQEGVKVHGCTVHFVTPQVDHGPIIVQAAVPVRAGDTESDARRAGACARSTGLPVAIRWFVEGRLAVENGTCVSTRPTPFKLVRWRRMIRLRSVTRGLRRSLYGPARRRRSRGTHHSWRSTRAASVASVSPARTGTAAWTMMGP